MISRRNFLTLIGAGIFVSMFNGCGESSKVTTENVENPVAVEGQNFFMEDIILNSGYKMPRLGLGTWTLDDKQAENCVLHALKTGYRLIDTARYYGNEKGVGMGVRAALNEGFVTREEIFVTSKVMPGNYNQPDAAIENSLQALNIGYVDLMLIHQPGANDEGVYKALERGVKAGKIRSIGISNYYTPKDFERINNIAEIVPAVVQNENHLLYQNSQLQDYVKKYGTVIESWYPFGGRGNTDKILGNSTIIELAEKYRKTPAQIIIRWNLQAGYIVIPGSKNPAHITENFNVFDFEISQDDMKKIFALNKNRRFENW